MVHMAGNTYHLLRGKKIRGMGARSRKHVVRGWAWGKAAAGKTKQQKPTRCCVGETRTEEWGPGAEDGGGERANGGQSSDREAQAAREQHNDREA